MIRSAIFIKNILSSKINWLHLMLFLTGAVLIAAFLYLIVIPITFWSIYGEGASSDRIGSLPFSIFIGEWAPLIIVLFITVFNIYHNMLAKEFSRAKSHILIALIVTILYLFRAHLLNLDFEIL